MAEGAGRAGHEVEPDGVGVHGTDARGSIGTNASHGCIRMLVEHVEQLYDEVPVGTPIYIH